MGNPFKDDVSAAAGVERPGLVTRGMEYPHELVSAGREVSPKGVRVECIVHGALVAVDFGGGVSPSEALAYLRGEDAGVKFKTEFPSKGGFGPKETKLTRARVIGVRVSDSGKFVTLSCGDEDNGIDVGVGRNQVESLVADLRGLGKIREKALARIEKAFAEKGQETIILKEEEQFGVKYWEKDGKRYSEGFVAEPPAAEAAS